MFDLAININIYASRIRLFRNYVLNTLIYQLFHDLSTIVDIKAFFMILEP